MRNNIQHQLYQYIQKDEKIFNFIQEGSIGGIWFWDLNNPEKEWKSLKIWQLSGYDPREWSTDSVLWKNIINQDDLKTAQENFRNFLIDPKALYDQTVCYRHKNYSGLWIRTRAVGIKDSETDSIRIIGVHQDVTDLKSHGIQNGKEMIPDLQNYKTMYENAPVAFHSLSMDGNILDINPKWLEFLGYKKEEVIGKWFGDFLHPDYVEIFKRRFTQFKKHGFAKAVKFKINCKNGETRTILFDGKIGTDINRERKQTFCIFKDITKEEALNDRLRIVNKVIDHSLNAFNILDKQGRFVYVNQAYVDMWAYKSKSEIISTSSAGHFENKNVSGRIIKELKEKACFIEEFTAKRKDGSLFDVKMYARIDHDSDGDEIYSASSIDISEQKKAKTELVKSEEKFREVFNNANIGIALADEKGVQIDINNEMLDMLGYSKEEFLAFSFLEITHPEDAKKERPLFKRLKNGEIKKYTLEKRVRKKNGEYIWVDTSISLSKGKSGAESMLILAFKEITNRKQTENELKKTLREQSLILSHDPAFIIFKDTHNNILRITETVAKMTGLPKNRIEGRNSKEIYPEMADKYFEDDLKVMKSGKARKGIIEPLSSVDGNQKWLLTDKVPYKNEKNEIAGIIVFSSDITELKENENKILEKNNEYEALNEELRQTNEELFNAKKKSEENERKLKNLIGNLKGLAYQCAYDKDWTMLFMSKGVKDLTGYGANDIINSKTVSWRQIIHEDFREQVESGVNEAVLNKKPFTLEYKIKCKNGEEKWVWEKGIVEMKGNQISHIDGFITDITPLKSYASELLAARDKAEEANRLKTEFLNNMSHEIRTPMNGIMGFSGMLGEESLSLEKRKYYSKIIQNSSHQLLRIIDDILEISTLETKQESINESEFSLNDFLMELFSIFNLKSYEQNLPLYIKKPLPDNQSYIVSDKSKLNKILGNFLENAFKYTNEGFIEFGYFLKKERLIFYVKDTGIGIAPENHQMIFERFSQESKDLSKKSGGLGLGLSISKENASLLGGEITLESAKGKGSVFYLNIPNKPAKSTKKVLKTENSDDPENKENYDYTILVAEDEEVNFLYIEALFESREENYNILHARNGKEAIDICFMNSKIDLVLMDIKMPFLNGNEATQKIKSRFPDIPVIAQTAYSTETEREEAMKSGCDEFLSKPINSEELFTKVSVFLKKKN